MALGQRYALRVTAAGDDTRGSGSSATIKDSDVLSGTTITVTQSGAGSPNRATVVRDDAAAFSGPPVALQDTIVVNGVMYHIALVSGDNKTLTLQENPATAAAVATWGIGGYFLTLARAAALAISHALTQTSTYSDDHVYVNVDTAITGATAVTFANATRKPSRPLVFEGYTTTPGDGGRKVVDTASGATATSSFSVTGSDYLFRNFKLTDTGNVTSWYCVRGTHAVGAWDNIWLTPNGSGALVGGWFIAGPGNTIRGRASGFITNSGNASFGQGFGTNAVRMAYLFSIAHDCDQDGFGDIAAMSYCIADTCVRDAPTQFPTTGGIELTPPSLFTGGVVSFCTSYNNAGPGYSFNDAQGPLHGLAFIGNVAMSNGNYGYYRTANAVNTNSAMQFSAFNDFHNNTNGTYFNGEDSTAYDATPTDKALDPQFTDAPNQDFTIGTNLKAAVTIALQVGGTSSLDAGALQRVEATGGGLIRHPGMAGGMNA